MFIPARDFCLCISFSFSFLFTLSSCSFFRLSFSFFLFSRATLERKFEHQPGMAIRLFCSDSPHCICEIHCSALDGFDFSSAHKLGSREQFSAEKSCQSWDSNPGPLGEKRECYLCAMRPPWWYDLLSHDILSAAIRHPAFNHSFERWRRVRLGRVQRFVWGTKHVTKILNRCLAPRRARCSHYSWISTQQLVPECVHPSETG